MSVPPPLKLAIFFDQTLHEGGGYQQALNAALLATKLPLELVEPIFFTNHKSNIEILRLYGINAIFLPLSFFRRVLLSFRRRIRHVRILKLWKKLAGFNTFERHFARNAVDLIYFLSPTPMANDLEELNYITTIWDLCHRDEPEFPEVRAGRVFEQRENLYRSILPKAAAVIVDSPLGKAKMISRYGLDEERLYVMPFTPAVGTQISEAIYRAGYIDIRKKYNLEVPYVFYPAQFWAHKNHIYLLEGLKCLETEFGEKVGAIFAGGDRGSLPHVRQAAARLDLTDRVRFAGFVPDEEIKYLYIQSLALVMPTYFGPSNLPPLEAFSLGVPVLYSDRAGLRDQVGDAALLMDLQEPKSLAGHLATLIAKPGVRQALVERGKAVLAQYSDEKRLTILTTILRNFQRRKACWG